MSSSSISSRVERGDAHSGTANWPVVHHGGRVVPRAEAVLPMSSIALRYGVSVFDGVRVYVDQENVPRPWLLEQHLARLRSSCRIMGLAEECCSAVPSIIDDLLRANGVEEDCYIRIAASAGNSGGIDEPAETVVTVSVTPAGRRRWLTTGEGMRLVVSTWNRASPTVFPSAAKNISAYAGPRLALLEAQAAGYDSCVLITADGLVSEAPTATVFLVEGDRLVTPRLTDSVLPGVTRAWVLATASALGLEAAAEPVSPDRLRAADEVFLCGTGLEFGPAREVDGLVRSGWPACPVQSRLVDAYFRQARGEASVTPTVWRDTDDRAGRPG